MENSVECLRKLSPEAPHDPEVPVLNNTKGKNYYAKRIPVVMCFVFTMLVIQPKSLYMGEKYSSIKLYNFMIITAIYNCHAMASTQRSINLLINRFEKCGDACTMEYY